MCSDTHGDDAHRPDDVNGKVREWLSEQGYPVEFRTANACLRHKFRIFQGYHVRDPKSDVVREIDVLASRDIYTDGCLVRVYHVIECKWSQDKPWVIFTSPTSSLSKAACVAQRIGNQLGSAVLWMIAGDPELHTIDLFSTPERPGYSGRRAFSKGTDNFYAAMASVTDLSMLLVSEYDWSLSTIDLD